MNIQILKLPEVIRITGRSGSSIYRGVAAGTFPKPIKLSTRSSGWVNSEVQDWLMLRIQASRQTGEA